MNVTAQQPSSTGSPPRHYLALTIVLVALTLFLGLNSLPLSSLNEARRALPIREMFLSGDWLIPTLNGEIYVTKPPLYYWIASFFATLVGEDGLGITRLPSALAGFLTALLCYTAVKGRDGTWAGVFALQILVANAGFAVHGRRAELELLQTLFCFGSLYCAWEYIRHAKQYLIYASHAFLGLSVMTKGPVALLFVTLPLLVYAIINKDRHAKDLLVSPSGWAVLLFVSLPWFFLVTQKLGLEAWQPILNRDIVEKVSGQVQADPIYEYFIWVSGAFFPAILILLWKPRETWQGFWHNRDHQLCLLAFVVPLLVFTLFREKHAKYLFPAFPSLAMLLGARVDNFRAHCSKRWQGILLWFGPALLFAFIAYFNIGEVRYFSQKYLAFPVIETLMARQDLHLPLYSGENFDVRAIYYIGRNVKGLSEDSLLERYRDPRPALFFFEGNPKHWRASDNCLQRDIVDFLKADQHIYVYRNGPDCTVTLPRNGMAIPPATVEKGSSH